MDTVSMSFNTSVRQTSVRQMIEMS